MGFWTYIFEFWTYILGSELIFLVFGLILWVMDLYFYVWTYILDVGLIFWVSGFILWCLDLYFGCLNLYLRCADGRTGGPARLQASGWADGQTGGPARLQASPGLPKIVYSAALNSPGNV